MKKILLTTISSLVISSLVPSYINASEVALRAQAVKAGLPDSAASVSIIRNGWLQEFKQVQGRISPEEFVSFKGQGMSVQQMLAAKQPAAVPATQAPTTQAATGTSPDELERLKREMEDLKRQLAAAKAATGGMPAMPATEDQKRVGEDAKKFIAELEADPAKIGAKDFINNARDLVERIENAQNAEAMIAFYEEIIKRMNAIDKGTAADVAKNLGVLAEDLDKNHYVADVILKKKKAEEGARILALANAGQGLIATVQNKIQGDPTYIKVSPLTVLLFLTKRQLGGQITQANITRVASFVKQTPLEDLQALYAHLYNEKVMPNDPLKITSAFMKSIGDAIDKNQNAPGFRPDAFDRRYDTKSQERGALTGLINNIPDDAVKHALLAAIAVGAPAGAGAPGMAPPPPPPPGVVPPPPPGAVPPPPGAVPPPPPPGMAVPRPPAAGPGAGAGGAAGGEIRAAGIQGTVSKTLGGGMVKLTAPTGGLPANTDVRVDASAVILNNKGPLQRNDTITFDHLKNVGGTWFIFGNITVTNR